MLSCLIYCTLTFLIPLKETYKSMKEGGDKASATLWSVYWGLFALIKLIQHAMPFLKYQPFEIVFMLFFIWLYHSTYRGALFLTQFANQKISSNAAISGHLKQVSEHLKFLHLFEDEAKMESKPKNE